MDTEPFWGWFDIERAFNLKHMMHNRKIETVLEIGSFLGKSTDFFINTMDCRFVTCVDSWSMKNWPEGQGNGDSAGLPENFFPLFEQNMRDRGCWEKIEAIQGDSEEVWRKMPRFFKADLVYIDASHDYESVKRDINLYAVHARKIICGDDYDENWPGVKQAVDEAFGDKVRVYGNIWWVEV